MNNTGHKLRKIYSAVIISSAIFIFSFLSIQKVYADPMSYDFRDNLYIEAVGRYWNWDGVTNVAQFKGSDGNPYFAVDSDTSVTVYKTDGGRPLSDTITLEKQHPVFGTAICDSNGNYYLVTGENNTSDGARNTETVFISKYDSNGNHISTTGDNGSSSLAGYYTDEFYTMEPFNGGNCDAAISGSILTVNYARKMYSGHQSNSIFSVNINNMSKVNVGAFYESHSFAQRVVPTTDGFVYMSEGDCFDRAFTSYWVKMSGDTVVQSKEQGVFDFWVEDGAHDNGNMYIVNENFAHMGGLVSLSNGNIAFVSQSAQSLSDAAENESEEIFVQIFDPSKDLKEESSYVTEGTRSGLAGNNGRTEKTNYGVKWLTSYGDTYFINNVQTVPVGEDKFAVLYELYDKESGLKGVYYIILDESGEVIQPATLFLNDALLNPCEMPVSVGNTIYWAGNRFSDSFDSSNKAYIYALDTSRSPVTINKNVEYNEELTYTGREQALVIAGDVTGGEFQYALGDDLDTPPADDKYSTSIPVGKEAKTYYVWYRVVGDSEHFDVAPKSISVTIVKHDDDPDEPGSGDDEPTEEDPDNPGNSDNPNNPYDPGNSDNPGNSDDPNTPGGTSVSANNEKTSIKLFYKTKTDISSLIQGTGEKVKYRSSNKKVARINNKGIATGGKQAGTATITKYIKETKKSPWTEAGSIAVINYNPTLPKKETLIIGNTINLNEKLTGSDETPVSWESSNTSAVTVTADGIATAVGQGTAKISPVFFNGKSKAKITIKVPKN